MTIVVDENQACVCPVYIEAKGIFVWGFRSGLSERNLGEAESSSLWNLFFCCGWFSSLSTEVRKKKRSIGGSNSLRGLLEIWSKQVCLHDSILDSNFIMSYLHDLSHFTGIIQSSLNMRVGSDFATTSNIIIRKGSFINLI